MWSSDDERFFCRPNKYYGYLNLIRHSCSLFIQKKLSAWQICKNTFLSNLTSYQASLDCPPSSRRLRDRQRGRSSRGSPGARRWDPLSLGNPLELRAPGTLEHERWNSEYSQYRHAWDSRGVLFKQALTRYWTLGYTLSGNAVQKERDFAQKK